MRKRPTIAITTNPTTELDYVVELSLCRPDGVAVRIAYVPDRAIITPEGFAAYAGILEDETTTTPEQLAAWILDDLNNEVVPRAVTVSVTAHPSPSRTHRVHLSDRQPGWDNSGLLGTALRQ